VEVEDATWETRVIIISEAKTKNATTTVNRTETETEVGALATNDMSDPAQLRKVIRVHH